MDELPLAASAERRRAQYLAVREDLELRLHDEEDWAAAMATVACALHHAFEFFHWTGFYRAAEAELLIVGPYQGRMATTRIPFSVGVCGAAARQQRTERVADVHSFEGHIACSITTESEIVVPVSSPSGSLLAVLDVDSNHRAAFTEVDQDGLEALCEWLGERYGARPQS